MKLDINGLPVVDNGDGSLGGGDSCANAARALLGGMEQFELPLLTCLTDQGTLVRNPTDTLWNKPDQLSRDQLKPFVWAMHKYRPDVVADIKNRYNYLFFWNKINKDLMSKLVYIRLENKWYSPTTNLWMDIFTFINIIIDCFRTNPDDVGDTLNLTADVRGSLENNPTIILRLGIKVWAMFRPKNYGNYKLKETNSISGAWAWYYRSDTGNNPEIASAWKPWIEEHIK